MLAVGLDAAELADALRVEGAAPEPDHRVGEDVDRDVLGAPWDDVLRAPAFRRADLEHAHPRSHVALEQERERVLVRAPVPVLPTEVAREEREVAVDLVVERVPALRLRHLHPALDLPTLLGDAGKPLVQQSRNPLLHAELRAASFAAERAVRLA